MLGLASIQSVAIAVLVLALTHLGAYGLGRYHERAGWIVERAQIEAQARATADRLRAEGRQLAADLELARANVRIEYRERIVTIREKASATRACFTPDVTAALNRQPIRETVERPGEPPREVVHEPAPTAGTSERAAAEWIATAQREHAACRAQVASLVSWIKSATGRQETAR
jgi:hypothetical protein